MFSGHVSLISPERSSPRDILWPPPPGAPGRRSGALSSSRTAMARAMTEVVVVAAAAAEASYSSCSSCGKGPGRCTFRLWRRYCVRKGMGDRRAGGRDA